VAPIYSGAELKDNLITDQSFLHSGCEGFDQLFGGFFVGEITELVGASASGKTQICLSSALHSSWKSKSQVWYIDTTNSFSAKRILEMYKASTDKFETKIMTEILSRICVFKVHDPFALLNVIEQIRETLSMDAQCLLILVEP